MWYQSMCVDEALMFTRLKLDVAVSAFNFKHSCVEQKLIELETLSQKAKPNLKKKKDSHMLVTTMQ